MSEPIDAIEVMVLVTVVTAPQKRIQHIYYSRVSVIVRFSPSSSSS